MSDTKKSIEKKNKINEIDEHIRRHFDIKKRLGKGAYGIVWKAIDRKTQLTVAVKKIFDAFRNETDAQRTFREIMFLRAFRNHPNIVQLYSIHRATNHMDIYLSFEFMESDLHNVIKRGSILKDIHKRYVMYQLLNATNFIHSGNVIHRDMKPSNVLVDSKCRCKLADFGLARSLSPNHVPSDRCSGEGNAPDKPCLTDYVATRWYRAPEILIANKTYTKGIDMWSLGCILGEMIRGKPLFPGSCTVNQVECIVSALPAPSEHDIQALGNGFGTCLLNQYDKLNVSPNPKLDDLLKDSPSDASTLIKSLIVLNPNKRLTAKQALYDKYVEKFRNAIPELELTADIVPPFRDDIQLSVSEYRSKLYEIMAASENATKVFSKKSTSLPSTIKSDESPPSSTDVNAPVKKKILSSSKSMEPFETRNARPASYILQPVVSDVKPIEATIRSRFTTKNLNCCKSCSQEMDIDSLGRANLRRVETVTMPKLQPNGIRSVSDVKYKTLDNKKSSMMPATLPSRESINATNNIFRRMSLKKPSEMENRFIDSDFRRQSLDDSVTNGGAVKRMPKQLSSIGEQQRMHTFSSIGDKFDNSHRKQTTTITNKKLMISDDHLKSLQSKIRKHKIDAMRNTKEYTYSPMQTKPSSMLHGDVSDEKYIQSKFDQFTNSNKHLREHARKINGSSLQNMGIDSVLHNNSKAGKSRSAALGGAHSHNYGIISANELYKLRKPTESII